MNDVETAFAAMLTERAERIAPVRGLREQTLRRARRRRVVNGILAGTAVVLLVGGGLGAVRALDTSTDPVRPAAPEMSGETTATAGTYGFWSTTAAEYPYVATGYFRGAEWELRAAATTLSPGSELRVSFVIGGAGSGSVSATATLDGSVDPLFVDYAFGDWTKEGDVALVYGTAPLEAETVEVSMQNGELVEAHVFQGYDNKAARDLDYFVAFVPADLSGEVMARDGEGRAVASAVIPAP